MKRKLSVEDQAARQRHLRFVRRQLRALFTRQKLTTGTAAALTNISQTTWGRILSGAVEPQSETLKALAIACGELYAEAFPPEGVSVFRYHRSNEGPDGAIWVSGDLLPPEILAKMREAFGVEITNRRKRPLAKLCQGSKTPKDVEAAVNRILRVAKLRHKNSAHTVEAAVDRILKAGDSVRKRHFLGKRKPS